MRMEWQCSLKVLTHGKTTANKKYVRLLASVSGLVSCSNNPNKTASPGSPIIDQFTESAKLVMGCFLYSSIFRLSSFSRISIVHSHPFGNAQNSPNILGESWLQ